MNMRTSSNDIAVAGSALVESEEALELSPCDDAPEVDEPLLDEELDALLVEVLEVPELEVPVDVEVGAVLELVAVLLGVLVVVMLELVAVLLGVPVAVEVLVPLELSEDPVSGGPSGPGVLQAALSAALTVAAHRAKNRDGRWSESVLIVSCSWTLAGTAASATAG